MGEKTVRNRYLPYKPVLKSVARMLRQRAPFPGRRPWSRLRRRHLGARFLRQRPIGGFVVDFFCPDYKLAIELDGRSHEETFEADRRRRRALEQSGLCFLRFTNDEVLRDRDGVVARVAAWLEEQPQELRYGGRAGSLKVCLDARHEPKKPPS